MKEKVRLDDREVTLVGVSHISEESQEEVKETIRSIEPDKVFLELDEERYESLRDEKGWEDLNLAEAIKQGKGGVLFFNLLLSIYQRKLGIETETKPGEEMLVGAREAENIGSEICLADRPIEETLSRLRTETSIITKFRILISLVASNDKEVSLDDLNQKGTVSLLVEELEDSFPEISEILLKERNRYMAQKIMDSDFQKSVAVVGSAHLEGIKEILENNSVGSVEKSRSPRIPWIRLVNYGIPLVILAVLTHTFLYVSPQAGMRALGIWIGLNSILALIAAVIARSHPVTWGVATLGSPILSLYPGMAAGVVSGYVEAKINPPTVKELEEVVKIRDYRELWSNQAGRVLLTLVLVNIASGVGAILAGVILVGSTSGAEELLFG